MKRAFNKYVNHLDEEELREELQRLYARFPVLREYYRMELGDGQQVVDKYRGAMHKAFFPTRGRGKRGRSQSRKLLRKFADISIHPRDLVALHFYRAELMARYIDGRRIESEAYHKSTVSAFAEAAAMAESEVLIDYFRKGARQLTELFDRQRRDRRYSFWPTYRRYWEN